MRLTLPFLLATLLAGAVPAAAQEDGCTQSNPCPWYVDVGADGFVTGSLDATAEWNWTVGDWVELSVFNEDDVAHAVTLTGYGVTLQVPSLEERSRAFELSEAGDFELGDDLTGDTAVVRVLTVDSVEFENGATGTGSSGGGGGIPSLALPIVAGALVAVAYLRLRKA